jgi:hypothetical protein
MAQPFMEHGDLFRQPTPTFLGVGEVCAQALLGDKRAGRQPPGSIGSGLTLPVARCGDARAELGVRVEEGDGHSSAATHGREGDGLAALLDGSESVRGSFVLGAAVLASGAPQSGAVVSHF